MADSQIVNILDGDGKICYPTTTGEAVTTNVDKGGEAKEQMLLDGAMEYVTDKIADQKATMEANKKASDEADQALSDVFNTDALAQDSEQSSISDTILISYTDTSKTYQYDKTLPVGISSAGLIAAVKELAKYCHKHTRTTGTVSCDNCSYCSCNNCCDDRDS